MRFFQHAGGVMAALLGASAAIGQGELVASGLFEFGEGPESGCISAAQLADAEAQRAAFLASDEGVALLSRGFTDARPFAFYPQAGNLYRDIYHHNYVDIDSSAGVQDFDCTSLSYNGHRGHDSLLRGFDEQEIGVPVFAVADGVVVAMADGEPDRNTFWNGQASNFVWIDHGQSLTTRYLHLKNGSVVHGVGETVEAGEQIGLTASSGVSDWPHLHFEARKFGVVRETMTGACDSLDDSWWTEQWEIERGFLVRDFGFARGNMSVGWAGPPFETPRSNHVSFDDASVSYWVQGLNTPAAAQVRFRFFAPDGTLAFDSGNELFSASAHRFFWSFWVWDVPAMREQAGDWNVRFLVNDEEAVSAIVRVFETEQPEASVNRPPVAVAATIEPAAPSDGDVIWARVFPDLVHDDPDFDVVRYTYRWTVNGEVVRETTSAAHADALAASFHEPGDVVECAVTAEDGVASACAADVTADGTVDGTDLAVLLAAWGGGDVDLTGDGVCDTSDLAVLLAAWGACM